MSTDIVARLAQLGGAARRAELVRRRADDAALNRAVSDGTVIQVGRGVYRLPDASPAFVAAAAHGAVIACVSAVELAGVCVLRQPARPHVAVPRSRGRRPSEARAASPAVVHRVQGADERGGVGAPVMALAPALARMLLCCPSTQAIVSVDDALRRRLTTRSAIERHLGATAPVGARVALARADGRSRSPLETVTRLALRAAGLPVRAGVVIPMVGEVDLLVAGRVVVELDGFAYHSGRREYREDRRRDRELVLQGYVVLRFTAEDVLQDMVRLVATVVAAVTAVRA